MRSIFKSKKGISPILATLLLIVIAVAAVIVTYAWVMTFATNTTNQATVLTVENTRFYGGGDDIEIVIRNTGTADAKIVEVYQGESSSDLQRVDFDLSSEIISAGSSLDIDIENADWDSGTRYYFKVVSEAGLNLPFNAQAP